MDICGVSGNNAFSFCRYRKSWACLHVVKIGTFKNLMSKLDFSNFTF